MNGNTRLQFQIRRAVHAASKRALERHRADLFRLADAGDPWAKRAIAVFGVSRYGRRNPTRRPRQRLDD